ncbi:hypothetical protein B0O99DRAFT_324757 [Bisporella sp. PMI_857]|nr:hypothetical protein B0O99DRAFT_368223 [Bisporella sp. PMI_857]KAH8600421.1 hypothetical protein B0O99DRAFT_324757 [Bisporella sp. PMI_857]
MSSNPSQLRSLYRSFLRELPSRTSSSPLQHRIRQSLTSSTSATSTPQRPSMQSNSCNM